MEKERIYIFEDKNAGVSYLTTKEEYEFLKKSYRKERYQMVDQHAQMKTKLFCDFADDRKIMDGSFAMKPEEVLGAVDDVEKNYMLEEMIKELFECLDPQEKDVVVKNVIEGYSTRELADSMGVTIRSVQRIKKKGIDKMRLKLNEQGYMSLDNILTDLRRK